MKDVIIRPVAICPRYQVEVQVIETAETPTGETMWRCQLCLQWHELDLVSLPGGQIPLIFLVDRSSGKRVV